MLDVAAILTLKPNAKLLVDVVLCKVSLDQLLAASWTG